MDNKSLPAVKIDRKVTRVLPHGEASFDASIKTFPPLPGGFWHEKH